MSIFEPEFPNYIPGVPWTTTPTKDTWVGPGVTGVGCPPTSISTSEGFLEKLSESLKMTIWTETALLGGGKLVSIDLPGVKVEGLKAHVELDVLIVTAKRGTVSSVYKYSFASDMKATTAEFVDCVLTVRLDVIPKNRYDVGITTK